MAQPDRESSIRLDTYEFRGAPLRDLEIPDAVITCSRPLKVDEEVKISPTQTIIVRSRDRITYRNGTTADLEGSEIINNARIGTGWKIIPQRPGDTIVTVSCEPSQHTKTSHGPFRLLARIGNIHLNRH